MSALDSKIVTMHADDIHFVFYIQKMRRLCDINEKKKNIHTIGLLAISTIHKYRYLNLTLT